MAWAFALGIGLCGFFGALRDEEVLSVWRYLGCIAAFIFGMLWFLLEVMT